MLKPTIDEFRRVRLVSAVFNTADLSEIGDAIDEAYDEYGFRRSKLACIYAAAHLMSVAQDDIASMDGDGAKAVDLGTGALLARDIMDGSRRTIGQTGAGTQPGVVGGTEWDTTWYLTVFGRKALDLERRASATRRLVVA